jgi:hypothetical protein
VKIDEVTIEECVGRGSKLRVVARLVLDQPCGSMRALAEALAELLEGAELDDDEEAVEVE